MSDSAGAISLHLNAIYLAKAATSSFHSRLRETYLSAPVSISPGVLISLDSNRLTT